MFVNFRKAREKNVKKGNKRIVYQARRKMEAGVQGTEIAEAIGVHRATIYNELRRGGTPYSADVAQRTV